MEKTNVEIQELKKRIKYLSKNTAGSDEVKAVQDEVNSLELMVVSQKTQLENLANVAISGDYEDLINTPTIQGSEEALVQNTSEDYFHYCAVPEYFGSEFKSEKIYFICSEKSFIKGTFNVDYREYRGNGFTLTLQAFFNEEVIFEKNIYINSASTTVCEEKIDFKVFPTKSQNYFYFKMTPTTSSQSAYVQSVDVDIQITKDIFFLTRDYRKCVFVSGHKYYIAENQAMESKFYVLDKDNFVFDNPISPAISAAPFLWVFPKSNFGQDYVDVDYSQTHMCLRFYLDKNLKFATTTSTPALAEFKQKVFGVGLTMFRQEDYWLYGKTPSATGVFTNSEILGYWVSTYNSDKTLFKEYKLNGQAFEYGIWVENIPVTKIDMTGVNPQGFVGSVAVRQDGTCVYIPHYDATYVVELGVGRMPSAFIQDDQSIHIYLGRVNHVTKFVLSKNVQTNQYEVVSKQDIVGAQQYHETLDGKAIVVNCGQAKLVDL